MLEVGGVVDARREHDDPRVAGLRRRDVFEHRQQLLGVVLHRADPLPREELWERPLHHLPIFEDVRHARRGAEVVLQDIHHAVSAANEVGAGDVAPHSAGRLEPRTGAAEALTRVDEPLGHHAIGHDPPLVVDVVDEEIERVDPLLEPAFDDGPLRRLDHARHDVEGPDLFCPGLVAVDVEGDAHREERLVGGPLPLGKFAVGGFGEAAGEQLRAGPWTQRRVEEFVVEAFGLIRLQVHGGRVEKGRWRGPWRLAASLKIHGSIENIPDRAVCSKRPSSRTRLWPYWRAVTPVAW